MRPRFFLVDASLAHLQMPVVGCGSALDRASSASRQRKT
ncbi:hypothetical protein HX91_1885 [Mycobacterium tuberculosis]|nr:hypothetical protein HX91_1885 [Mycobacterium tuberculosis]